MHAVREARAAGNTGWIGGTWMLALLLLTASTASAGIGTPPPFFCGKTYVFAKAVPNGNVVAGGSATVRVNTLHYVNKIQFAGNCPAGTQSVMLEATLDCVPGPSAGPEVFGPFALTQGFTEIPIDVTVPAGAARQCALIVTATLTFSDGSQIAQTADQVLTVVDAASGDPNEPLIEIELVGPDIVRVHPGDGGAFTYRIINHHPSEAFDGTFQVDMRNVADLPQVISGLDDTAVGVFSVSDPGGGTSFPISLDTPDGECVPEPEFPHTIGTSQASQSISIPASDFLEIEIKGRTFRMSADGASAESTATVDGSFSGGAPGRASAGAVLAADQGQAPAFACPTDTGRSTVGVAASLPAGPAAGIVGDSTIAGDHPWQVDFAIDTAAMQLFVDGAEITGGTPDFSSVTQVDGQHVRVVGEFSFIVPLAPPGAVIQMVLPFVVRRDNSSSADITTELREMSLIGGVPAGFADLAPTLSGRVDVTGIADPQFDSILDVALQMSAVGVEEVSFDQVEMTNLGVEIELVDATHFVVTSTWTATNPGATSMIGFDVSNDFRGFVREGDYDGDGVVNSADVHAFIYNPDQTPGPVTLSIDQVDVISSDGSPLLIDSDYGMLDVFLHNPADVGLYINAEVDGVWQVRNMPVGGTEFIDDLVSYATMFEIGTAGVDLSGSISLVRVAATTRPLEAGMPAGVPFDTAIIGRQVQQHGADESGPEGPPRPAAGAGVFPRPAQRSVLERAARPGFEMVDLDGFEDAQSCTPGAIAGSMVWLNRTYCLGAPNPGNALDLALDELRPLMQTPGRGTSYSNMVPAKRAYIRKHQLPLKVEVQGRASAANDAFNPDDLFKQMQLGQDVEINMRYGGASFEDNGHTAPIVAMTREGEVYTITLQDDLVQDAAGGNDKPRTALLVFDLGAWHVRYDGDDMKAVGWLAESPTKAAINRAACEKSAALRDLIIALGGTAPTTIAREILKQARHVEFLARRLLANVDCDPASTPAQSDSALEMATRSVALVEAAEEVLDDVGSPFQSDALDAARDFAAEVKDLSVQFRGLFPPDADFDDVPDSADNAPGAANPDQLDCDGDGVGDVAQLGENDCNGNGVPDACDLDPTDPDGNGRVSSDVNANGIPDECDCLGDVNSDGTVGLSDLAIVLSQFGAVGAGLAGDIDGDGDVDLTDLAIVLSNFGIAC